MSIINYSLSAGLLLSSVIAATAAIAQPVNQTVEQPTTTIAANTPTTVIDIGGHSVPVIAGGMYDRYRSNAPLSAVAAGHPEIDLSWFQTIEKTKLDVGFETWSPNFYYSNSKVTVVYTADIDRLRELMPAEVKQVVQPIQTWPGRGLVAITGYAYHYCDNDSYNELSLSIVTSKPKAHNLGPISLVGQSVGKDFWGYVLKLPVDTELARVRGVVGYNLPKWLIPIAYQQDEQSVSFELADAATGKTDVILRTRKLEDLSDKPDISTNNFTNINAAGELTVGHSDSRNLAYASTGDDDAVELILSNGSLSQYIRALDLGEMVSYEYVPDFQMALYAPQSLQRYLGETQR